MRYEEHSQLSKLNPGMVIYLVTRDCQHPYGSLNDDWNIVEVVIDPNFDINDISHRMNWEIKVINLTKYHLKYGIINRQSDYFLTLEEAQAFRQEKLQGNLQKIKDALEKVTIQLEDVNHNAYRSIVNVKSS